MREEGVAKLLRVPAKLLSEGDGNGVHEMRASDLDDGLPFPGLGVELVAEEAEGGDESLLDLVGGGDRHGGGEGVVAGLRHVAVVVRVDGVLLPTTPPRSSMARLDMTSLTFMLVCVPLPVCQTTRGKWSSSLPSMTSRAATRIGSARLGELSEALVDGGGGVLDDGERAKHLHGHLLAPNLEVLQRALGLRAPVLVHGNEDDAHGVALLANARGRFRRIVTLHFSVKVRAVGDDATLLRDPSLGLHELEKT